MIVLICIFIVSAVVSHLCSLTEACLLSLSHANIAEIFSRKPKIAAIWTKFKTNIQKPIVVILVINTIASTVGASFVGAYSEKFFGSAWVLALSFAYAYVIIQWSEVLPKTLGVRYNTRVAYIAGKPLRLLVSIFTPVVWFMEMMNKPFIKKRGDPGQEEAVAELTVMTRYAQVQNFISRVQERIINRAIEVKEKKAKDIMIPVSEMKVLTLGMTLAEALIEAHIHNHTRYPLVKEKNSTDITGYVNFKDIVSALRINPTNPSLAGIKRPISRFDEEEPFISLFTKMTASHLHVAVITGKGGAVVGLITLEDLIEEIIGEINDEYDVLPDHLYRIDVNRHVAGGGVDMKKLNRSLGLGLPDYGVNIADWLFMVSKPPLKAGEKYTYMNTSFFIKKMKRSRVYEVIIEIENP